jgi:imidazole glycerol-phosphate synthase subunit HisH
MITIIDYGVGNLSSIANMLKRIGEDSIITSDINKISEATKFILPGVGSFDYGINQLKQSDYFSVLCKKVQEEKTPLMGVCLGMQLLSNGSEEGSTPGLGWIDGYVKKFDSNVVKNAGLKIPHMGWTDIEIKKNSMLLTDLPKEANFYFVHSYYFQTKNQDDILLTSNYGDNFTSGIEKDNIVAVQFHPEKSHKYGMQLYRNFAKLY